jgi:hypothetical protein
MLLTFSASRAGIFALAIATLLFAEPRTFAQAPPAVSHAVPPERFYPFVFRQALHLQGVDAKASVGLSPAAAMVPIPRIDTSLARFFTQRVGLNAQENAVLLREAQQWKQEADPVDAQAHALIDSIHAKTPGGKLAPGQQPPQVPPELIKLQQQKDAITLRHVADLQTKLGPERFAALDRGIRQQVRSGPLTTPANRATFARGTAANK